MDEKEVDLRDYIKLIFENKKLILAMFLLGIIAAIGFNFIFIPKEKIYEGKTLLEIGYKSKLELVEQLEQLLEKIERGVYGIYTGGKITALNPKNTNLIEIKIGGSDPDKIKSVLDEISGAILEAHNKKISAKKEILENEISRMQIKIDLLAQEEKSIESEMKISNQQLILFLLKNDLRAEGQQLNKLKEEMADIQLTEIVSSSVITEKSSSRKSLLNVVVGGISGLFTGIFLAFLLVWWRKPIKMV